MNYKYLCLILLVCFVIPFYCCACGTTKQGKIVIKRESKYAKAVKKKVSNVIDLSDGKQVNFDFQLGPQDVSTPSFSVINLDRH